MSKKNYEINYTTEQIKDKIENEIKWIGLHKDTMSTFLSVDNFENIKESALAVRALSDKIIKLVDVAHQ